MSKLELQSVSLSFGGLRALQEVTIAVPAGSIFAVIGPNGAGKTSLFNLISGIYSPTSGAIEFNGAAIERAATFGVFLRIVAAAALSAIAAVLAYNLETLWQAAITSRYIYLQSFDWSAAAAAAWQTLFELPAHRTLLPAVAGGAIGVLAAYLFWQRGRRSPEAAAAAGIARTFQNIRLFRGMTAIDNVLAGMELQLSGGTVAAALRLPAFFKERKRALDRAREILKFVGLEEQMLSRAGSLSYGHQRKLEIARALASNPRLLLLDEPAAGMNPSESRELTALIARIRATGVTVVLIEHQMQVVMGISERIAVLDYGKKIAEGSAQEIQNNPAVIEAYLGKSEG